MRISDWSSDVCSSDLVVQNPPAVRVGARLSKAPYQYTLQDIDLDELYKWAGIIETKLRGMPGFQDVTSDLAIASPSIVVDINRDKAATLGVTAEQIEGALARAYGSKQENGRASCRERGCQYV